MRRILFVLMASAFFTSTVNAVSTPFIQTPTLNTNEIFLPVGNTGKSISLMGLAQINVKDFELITQRKLTLFKKIGFKLAQKKLRSKLNDDGTIKTDVAKKLMAKMTDQEKGFDGGGFLLGLLFSWLGVLAAYLLPGDNRKNRVKWAWIGFGVSFFLLLFLISQFFKPFR